MLSSLRYVALSTYLKSWEVLRHIRSLRESQWVSSKEIEKIQLQKLKALVKHAYENVPFYHQRFRELKLKPRDIKSFRDLKKLPIMRKDDLRNNFPATLARNYKIKSLKRGCTSGSTGKPLDWYIDKRGDCRNWAAYYRFASWYAFYPGDKMISLSTARPWSHLSNSIGVRLRNKLQRWPKLTAYRMNEQTFRDFLTLLRRFKPKILHSFTSPVFLFSKYLRKEGIADIRPSAVVTTGETLQDFQRRQIESVFNCKVFDFYGSSEINSIAQECEEHSGLHINAEDRIVEFVRCGENVSSGEEGEIVITDLNNYAMPFIRYGNDDVGIPSGESCICGRSLPLIRQIKGRVCDLIVAKDGRVLAGEFFALPAPYLLKSHEWLQQYQIIQPSREELLIRIVKSAEPKKEDLEYLISRIHKHLGDIEIKIDFVNSIPLANKRRFVISNVTPELFNNNQKKSLSFLPRTQSQKSLSCHE